MNQPVYKAKPAREFPFLAPMPFPHPRLKESLQWNNSFMQIVESFAGLPDTDIGPLDSSKEIMDIREIVPMCTNGIAGVGHNHCGCPGISGMTPHLDGRFQCGSCEGWISKDVAEQKLSQGLYLHEKALGAMSLQAVGDMFSAIIDSAKTEDSPSND